MFPCDNGHTNLTPILDSNWQNAFQPDVYFDQVDFATEALMNLEIAVIVAPVAGEKGMSIAAPASKSSCRAHRVTLSYFAEIEADELLTRAETIRVY